MKTFLPLAALICLALGAVTPAAAQITITAADIRARFAVGALLDSKIDTLTKSANIGATGATSWDFSGLQSSRIQTSTSVLPDTTPFIGYFPGSTHAMRQASASGVTYSYFALGSDLLFQGIGSAGVYQTRIRNNPAPVQYKLPMTMGTQWTTAYAESLIIVLPSPLPPQVTVNSVTVTSMVDAYGLLTLPGGSVSQALRVKTDRRSVSSGVTSRLISYTIIGSNYATVGLTPADTLQPASGTIAVSSISWNGPTKTGVPPGEALPAGFALGQNYPNPFDRSTTIRFDLPQSAFVTLAVVNVLGQEVASLVRRELPAGSHSQTFDASALPDGVYFVRLQTPAASLARKMVVARGQ